MLIEITPPPTPEKITFRYLKKIKFLYSVNLDHRFLYSDLNLGSDLDPDLDLDLDSDPDLYRYSDSDLNLDLDYPGV